MADEHLDPTEPVIVNEVEPAESAASPRKKAIIILSLVFLAVAAIGSYLIWLRSSPTVTAEVEEEKVVSVKVAKAEKESISREFSAIGTVVPSEQASVSASISAQIKQMPRLNNSLVHKGDVIAVLESTDLSAQRDEARSALEEARLNLQTLQNVTIPQSGAQSNKDVSDAKAAADNARATLERRRVLYEKGGISLKELEASQLALTNAENAYRLGVENSKITRTAINPNARAIAESRIKQAQDRLQSLEVQVQRGVVRAPITGIVTEQTQFEGEFAQQGAKLLTVADIGTVIVKAQFADTVVKELKVGDMVTVFPSEAPDERMTGRVTLISRASDPQNRTVEVWANFGNPLGLLTSGGAVQFVVTSAPIEEAVIVPESAVTLEATNAEEGTVMIVDAESIAHEAKVKIGIRNGGNVQIVEGLEGGETIVTEGNYALPDGTKVEAARDEEGSSEEKP